MESKQYSKRIRYLRRLIITTVAAACLIPTCICVILAIRYDRLHTEYEKSMADLEWYREQFGSERDILASEAEPGEKPPYTEPTERQPVRSGQGLKTAVSVLLLMILS